MPEIFYNPEEVATFKAALIRHTDNWGEDRPNYTSPPGTEGAYDQMGRELLERVCATEGVSDAFRVSEAVGSGMGVIPRFLYAGGAKAALQGFGLGQLKNGMYNHASFNTMSELTREHWRTTELIERELGVRPLPSIRVSINDFELNEVDGLTITHYYGIKAISRGQAYKEGHIPSPDREIKNPIHCIGQITGINATAYRSMLTICLNDPFLYPATLMRSTESIRQD